MTQHQRTQSEGPDVLRNLLQTAYERLRKNELIVLCSLRSLGSSGSHSQLAKRLVEHEVKTYEPSAVVLQSILPEISSRTETKNKCERESRKEIEGDRGRGLPLELVAEIVDHIGDWELSKAVGLPTSLPRPTSWARATELDLAILSRSLARVQRATGSFYTVSAKAAIRFSCVEIIDYLHASRRQSFDKIFGPILPLYASLEGSVKVLDWYKEKNVHVKGYDNAPMDNASLNGHVHVLQWWLDSGLPLKYSEAALEHASSRGHITVLEWWKASGLPLKIGRVMELASGAGHVAVLSWWVSSGLEYKYDKTSIYNASTSGRVDVLDWWAESGLHMIYDPDVLVGATRNNRPETLDWWDRSGLPIQYRLCDIEEALEDAMGDGRAVREWWGRKGVDFRANFTEWTRFQNLR